MRHTRSCLRVALAIAGFIALSAHAAIAERDTGACSLRGHEPAKCRRDPDVLEALKGRGACRPIH